MSDTKETKEIIEESKENVEEVEESKVEETEVEEAEIEEPKVEETDATEEIAQGNKGIKFWHIATGFVGLLVLVYLGFTVFFTNHFYFNTIISGNDCSGKSIERVVKQLEEQAGKYSLTIVERDGKSEVISSKDISLSHELGDVLEKAIEEQRAILWIAPLFAKEGLQVSLEMNYDKAALEEKIDSLHCMADEMQVAPVAAKPIYNGTSFEIAEEILGTEIEKEVLYAKAHEAIALLVSEINLEESGCYVAPRYTKDSEEVIKANDVANKCIETILTYQAGKETVIVDAERIVKWISFDKDMKLAFDNTAMKKFVKNVGKKFDTVGTVRTIKTPTGKKAEVSGGTYGRVVNQAKELTQLKKDIKAGKVQTREPLYSQKVASDGKYEWGDTYLEVDITEQHMWYIVDGEVAFESDVVTGVPNVERMTPQGVYSILEKMRNKILRGNIMPNGKREYETPVSYWMRVTWSGIGFHDATWQRAFGGQRYKQGYGSHGCINMPLKGIAQLYEMVEKGCPVIIHY